MCARGSLQMEDPKKSPKIAMWAPSHNFVGRGAESESESESPESGL